MGALNFGDVTGPGIGDWWKGDYVIGLDGRWHYCAYARAQLTDTLQTTIPLLVYEMGKKAGLSGQFPPKPLTLPVGAQVSQVALDLPPAAAVGEASIYGVQLPKGCTIIGTTGENLKVSTTATPYTNVAPIITAANNLYTPGTQAVAGRSTGQADASSPELIRTFASAATFQIAVSNAANTAAGNGIRLSQAGAIAFIYASIRYAIPPITPIPRFNLDYPAMPD